LEGLTEDVQRRRSRRHRVREAQDQASAVLARATPGRECGGAHAREERPAADPLEHLSAFYACWWRRPQCGRGLATLSSRFETSRGEAAVPSSGSPAAFEVPPHGT